MLFVTDPGVLSSIIAQAQRTHMTTVTQKPVLQTQVIQKPFPDWPIKTSTSWPQAQVASTSAVIFNQVWTQPAEKLILDIYRQMESGPPMKNKWEHVSKQMEKKKHKFSSEQCRLKIKSLKERYLKLQKKLNKSGSDNPTVPDDGSSDLEETFSTQPDVHPVCTVDSEEREWKKERQIIQKDKTRGSGEPVSLT